MWLFVHIIKVKLYFSKFVFYLCLKMLINWIGYLGLGFSVWQKLNLFSKINIGMSLSDKISNLKPNLPKSYYQWLPGHSKGISTLVEYLGEREEIYFSNILLLLAKFISENFHNWGKGGKGGFESVLAMLVGNLMQRDQSLFFY